MCTMLGSTRRLFGRAVRYRKRKNRSAEFQGGPTSSLCLWGSVFLPPVSPSPESPRLPLLLVLRDGPCAMAQTVSKQGPDVCELTPGELRVGT